MAKEGTMTDRELRIIKHAVTAIIKKIKEYQKCPTDDFDTDMIIRR